jgi:hypothetical protein
VSPTLVQSLKSGIVATGRRVPWLTNPLWTAVYPYIRRDEYHGGDLYDGTRQQVFEEIYTENLWHSEESRSGDGSSMAQTESIRAALPGLLAGIGGSVILDAPCGDYHWMRHVDFNPGVEYIGADIVRPLVDRLQHEFGGPSRSFRVLDIVADEVPACDLWLCRDVLFHLPHHDIMRVLARIDPGKTRYLLTTTFPWLKTNRDIRAGGFRFLNLQIAPFFLPKPVQMIDDFSFPEPPRVLALWSSAAIAEAAARFGLP